jgi:hypothetical protein
MASANSAPDCSESVFSLARVSFVDVSNTLAEVVLGAFAVVDTLKSQDSLIGVLDRFSSK